jgi:hypothetical protein
MERERGEGGREKEEGEKEGEKGREGEDEVSDADVAIAMKVLRVFGNDVDTLRWERERVRACV